VDDTGVEVHYTLIPYAQEAQAMVVGDGSLGLTGASVGAGAMSHKFDCPSACTASHFASPMTVFAETLHQHETGSRPVYQVRRAVELYHEAAVDVWNFRRSGIKLVQQAPYSTSSNPVMSSANFVTRKIPTIRPSLAWARKMKGVKLAFGSIQPLRVPMAIAGTTLRIHSAVLSTLYTVSYAPADIGRFFGSVHLESPALLDDPPPSGAGLVSWSSFTVVFLADGFYGHLS
jgi:hypothetical protein